MRLASRPLVAALMGFALLLTGCGADLSASDAATVEDITITRSQVEEPVRDAVQRLDRLDGLSAEERAAIVDPLQRQILSLLIQATIIDQIAEERGIAVDPDVLAGIFAADVEGAGGEDELADALANQQLSLGLYRDVLIPTQQLVEAMRDGIEADLEPTEAREARHILVETEAEAQEILAELDAGADFAELAEERSTDPGSAARGGDLGPAQRGAYVGPFDEAVWSAALGQVVGPIETQFGFHVLEVTDEQVVAPADLPEDERRDRVTQQLNQLLEERFTAADVEVSPRFGVWDAQAAEVRPSPEVGSGQ